MKEAEIVTKRLDGVEARAVFAWRGALKGAELAECEGVGAPLRRRAGAFRTACGFRKLSAL